MYGCGICFVNILLLGPDSQRPSLPLCVCGCLKGGEEGTLGFDLRAQNVLQVTPFHINAGPRHAGKCVCKEEAIQWYSLEYLP